MTLSFNQTKFIKSYSAVEQIKNKSLPEFAFIGRSNVGKSSLINSLCSNKNLAKTSSKPGKTQLINFFGIEQKAILVDLPGYGYAKVSKKKRLTFEGIITEYLKYSKQLFVVFVLVDCSIPPQKIDLEFISWCGENGIPFMIIFTKSDKRKPNEIEKNIENFEINLHHLFEELPPYFITSAKDNKDINTISKWISEQVG